MILLEDLSCGYTAKPILENINWEIKSNEHWLITGPMASGKTTLLNTIVGKTRKLSGKIEYPFLDNPGSYEERKKSIHLVSFTDTGKLFHSVNAVHYYQQRYQAFDSDGHLTVRDYLKDGGLDLDDSHHLNFIELMKLQPLLDMERIKLSSGQTRKILLCKAFLGQPRFLLLDNPHMGLDDASRNRFNHYLDQLTSHFNQQIILSGHFRSIPNCINRNLDLQNGRIAYLGKPRLKEIDRSGNKSKAWEKIEPEKKLFEGKPCNTILKFDQIEIKYKDEVIFRNLDWTVKMGEKWLVSGPNGSGKSTIISLIYGDHPQAYSNKIILFDRRRGTGESIWDIKKRIGFTSPELHSFFDYNHTAEDVVLSGVSDTLFPQNYTSQHAHLCLCLLEYFQIENYKKAPFKSLSSGIQRLIFFIRALIKQPPVLLLDEPYQGLDYTTVQRCNDLLKQMLSPLHTLIFISHFPDEVPDVVTKTLSLA